nr:hypothetical protein [Curtobacterium sp. Leaf183]
MVLIVFLGVNGRTLTMSNDQACAFVVAIAEGRLDDVDAVAGQLRGAVAPT